MPDAVTPPDRLVQAAVKEYAMYTDERMTKRQVDGITHALAAAFAALPECEDVIMAVAEAMPHGWTDDDGVRHDDVSKGNYNTAKAYLAALAREFGDKK